jgi:hypothetical protein
MNAELAEQSENAAGLGGTRSVVIARHHHDLRARECRAQSAELQKGVNDGGVRWSNVVKDVAADQHELGTELYRAVDCRLKRARDVRLPLVDTARSQPLILSKSEVQVR